MKNLTIILLFLLTSFDVKKARIITVTQQYNRAQITGQKVILRNGASTSDSQKGILNKDEIVTILDSSYPNNRNEAILKNETNFYNENSGNFSFKLNRGKAVKVIESIGNDTYKISFKNVNGSIGVATIGGVYLDFINGEKWYKIQRQSGLTGWVFGKYVQEID